MAGRPRTPTNVLELRGAFKQHPERRRDRAAEPKPEEEVGDCPARLGDAVAEAWDYIRGCVPVGVLTCMDRVVVTQAAVLLADLWRAPSEFTSASHARLTVALSQMGMTPAARSKVAVPKRPDEDNPYAGM